MNILVVSTFVLALVAVSTGRWNPRGHRSRCRYIKGEWNDCDAETNTVTRVMSLQKGGPECEEFKNQTISCERYNRMLEVRDLKLKRRMQWAESRQQMKQERQNRIPERKEMKEQLKRCKYDHSEWSECDNTTNTASKILTLLDGDETCNQTHTMTISCNKLEGFLAWKAKKIERKEERKEAMREMIEQRKETKQQMKEQKKERKHQMKEQREEAKQQMKEQKKEQKHQMKEQRKENRKQRKQLKLKCKYDKGEWSLCDERSKSVKRVLTLRDGDEECEQVLDVTISCDRYDRIQQWKAQKMERKGNNMEQKQQRKEEISQLKENWKLMKQQRKRGCSFDVTFSECDPVTNMVTKTYTTVEEDNYCESRSLTYSCDLHIKLMNKKKRRQEIKIVRRLNRRTNRHQQV